MPVNVRERGEEMLREMETALRAASGRTERVMAAFGDCETAHFVNAAREIASLQTTLGDLSILVDGLRSVLAEIDDA